MEMIWKKYQQEVVFLGFALLSFIVSLFMGFPTETIISKSLSPTGGEVGPFEIAKDNMIIEISARKSMSNGDFATLSVEILDKNKEYLSAFAEDVYFESGWDSDGYWSEGKQDATTSITVPEAGTYYLKVEAGDSTNNSSIDVTVKGKAGSDIPFQTLGILALICAVAVFVIRMYFPQIYERFLKK